MVAIILVVLLVIVHPLVCQSFVKRYGNQESNGIIILNTFPNIHNLCNKGYCESRHAGCKAFDCCRCLCQDNRYFVSQEVGCLGFRELKNYVLKQNSLLGVFMEVANGLSPILITSSDKKKEVFLKYRGNVPLNYNSCVGSIIYYLNYDGVLSVYSQNLCEKLILVRSTLKQDILVLKWNNGEDFIKGSLFFLKIKCSTVSQSMNVSAVVTFQTTGKFKIGTTDASIEDLSETKVCESDKSLYPNLSDEKNKQIDEPKNKSKSIVIGLIIGFVCIIVVTVIGAVVVYFLFKKSQKKRQRGGDSNKQATEENDYFQVANARRPEFAETTVDAGGYLLPKDCGILQSSEKQTPEKPNIDENGYVCLRQFNM